MPHLDLGTTNAIKTLLKGNAQEQKIVKILKGALERVYPMRTQGKVRWRTGSHSQPCSDLPVLVLSNVKEMKFPIALQVYSSTAVIKL